MGEYSPAWLELREPADAAARAAELVDRLLDGIVRPVDGSGLVVHDLGCGTGSMGRWLAPRLPGPQHWVLHDRDPALLHRAAAAPPPTAGGFPVTLATRTHDLTAITAGDLAGAGLVTASALLDLLTRAEVQQLAAAGATAGAPALFTLSVDGQVTLSPPDPLDQELTAAFNAHQRRAAGNRQLLGPDAAEVAAAAFAAHGATVVTRPSPWRLGPDRAALTAAWLEGWVDAACAQRPELAPAAAAYRERRLTTAAAGELEVVVGHQDLLAYWDPVHHRRTGSDRSGDPGILPEGR